MAKRAGAGRADVRFGGHRTPSGYVFELTGGALCLDFANTLDDRKAPAPRELLAGFEDLVAWGVQAGAVARPTAIGLLRQARAHPRAAARALDRARRVREAIFATGAAAAHGRVPPRGAIALLNDALPAALASRRLALRSGPPVWVWPDVDPPHPDRVLWPVVVSAADLLTSGGLGRVRECAGERCSWLFLDRSRNGSRRWCDMTVCGNRAKARRHRARVGRRGARTAARGHAAVHPVMDP